ncbi:uncharacterized protein LOC129020621 isoform X2 [Pongo pygmaeus]|uniref:uncharacterized protein LOC129020621 isoform X2 n=1 Tax=Pongo pygmaeus TaxID=9600 RepID=UPI00300CDA6A
MRQSRHGGGFWRPGRPRWMAQACSSRGTDDHLRSSESLGFCPLQRKGGIATVSRSGFLHTVGLSPGFLLASPTAFSASDLGRWTQGLLLDRAVEGAACLEDALRMEGAGADMMSDTSSGSLEVSLGSWETSFATVSPGESGHSWEDGDTCNRHWSFQDPE